jgi:mediator of RNA polymerase II transcription subunit 16
VTRLRYLGQLTIPKIVVTIHTMQLGRVICFAFSDGTVQYRDRFTMNEVYNEPSPSSIMSPLQAGFRFVNDTPCTHPFLATGATTAFFSDHADSWASRRSSSCFFTYPLLLCPDIRGLDNKMEPVTLPS